MAAVIQGIKSRDQLEAMHAAQMAVINGCPLHLCNLQFEHHAIKTTRGK